MSARVEVNVPADDVEISSWSPGVGAGPMVHFAFRSGTTSFVMSGTPAELHDLLGKAARHVLKDVLGHCHHDGCYNDDGQWQGCEHGSDAALVEIAL